MNYSDYRKLELSISKDLNEWFHVFCEQNTEYKMIESLYTQKEVHLNGVQFVAGFHAHTRELTSWKKFAAIPVAIELIMIWAYKTNQILDHKQGVWGSERNIKDTVLEHDLISSCIIKLLEEQTNVQEGVRKQIFKFIKELPVGFLIERDCLNNNYSSLKSIKSHWKEKYIERNIKFNSLYDTTPIIGYILASNKDIFIHYLEKVPAEWRFSHIGQIINDLSDCIPEHDANVKSYQDQCADIRNGIITYPVFELLDSQVVLQALEQPIITKELSWQNNFFEEVTERGLGKKVKEMAESCYQRHDDFWKTQIEIPDEFLMRTYMLLRENKYFKKFERI